MLYLKLFISLHLVCFFIMHMPTTLWYRENIASAFMVDFRCAKPINVWSEGFLMAVFHCRYCLSHDFSALNYIIISESGYNHWPHHCLSWFLSYFQALEDAFLAIDGQITTEEVIKELVQIAGRPQEETEKVADEDDG